MQTRIAALTLALIVATTSHVAAQDQNSDAENSDQDAVSDLADTLSTGQTVDENGEPVGEAYVAEEHGDWQVRCIRSPEEDDPCQLYQLLKDSQGGSVAEITMFPLPEGRQAVAGATIITPPETLLTEQVTVQVDGGAAKRYPYSVCTQTGCISRIGFTADDVAAFQRGSAAKVRIVPAVAPDQEVILTLSLTGFTAAFNAMKK